MRKRHLWVLGLLSLPSGVPLGFVFNTLQIFLRGAGVDLKTIGLLSSVSLPWSFKFLWSPLVDRYAFAWPGRRRSWVLIAQGALALGFGGLAAYVYRSLTYVDGRTVLVPGAAAGIAALALFIAFWAATQDIGLDAYAVEVLRPEETGPASGLRIMFYRLGMLVAGALAIALSDVLSWPVIFAGLGGLMALCMLLTLWAEEPEKPAAPPASLALAVWEPLKTYFARPQAITAALFLVFYKFGDNLAQTMVNPFLKDMCFTNAEIGIAVKVVGTTATIAGSAFGAFVMARMGLGRALWVFGLLQACSCALYAIAASTRGVVMDVSQCAVLPPLSAASRLSTYVAIAGEYSTAGMGTAALTALLLRLCEKRYSATHYALLSSLFGLGRTFAGIPSGVMAQKLGYPTFFATAMALAIPGFVLLQKLAPVQQRDVPSAPETVVLPPAPQADEASSQS